MRDRHGIPHIYAASLEDAHFALGFVHAQDRLWQMEMNRRIGSGTLAEVLGPAALETDRFMRTLGLARAWPRRTCGATTPRRAAMLDAYAAGVNAFLAGRPRAAARVLAAERFARALDARSTRSCGPR